MAVLSKLFTQRYVTCQEFVHPWTASCYTASSGLLLSALFAGLQMYMIVYILALVMKGKKPTLNDIKRTLYGIIQSTAFIGCHAIGFSMCACLFRNTLGYYNFFTFAFLPTFVSSWFAILVERPSRRSLLSLYVTNVASETLYYMLLWRGVLKPVPFADIIIFSTSVAHLLYSYRGPSLDSNDSVFSLLRYIVGPYERIEYNKCADYLLPIPEEVELSESISVPETSKNDAYRDTKKSRKVPLLVFVSSLCAAYKNVIHKLKKTSSSPSCPHPYGCLHYCLQGGTKWITIGFGLQISLAILAQMKKIVRRPVVLWRTLKRSDTFRLGAFLGGFSFLFRGISCALRRACGTDTQNIAIPAAFVAGLTFFFYRSNTIALYFMWKSAQIVYKAGIDDGMLPEIPHSSIIFHCLSTAILFHAALFEPQNLRSSYWKFLKNMSGGRIGAMGRKCLDCYGLESSKMVDAMNKRHGSPPIRDFLFLGGEGKMM